VKEEEVGIEVEWKEKNEEQEERAEIEPLQ
jgi:hypothetical protein